MKKRFIAWFYPTLKFLIVLVIILILDINPGCKDPYDYEPQEDPLLPAPEPPQLISPRDSVYYFLPTAFDTAYITFKWSAIEDIEFYEFEIDTTILFGRNAWSRRTVYDTVTFGFSANEVLTITYYWHVRAASDLWIWWTEWSDVRCFIIPWAGSLRVQYEKPDSSFR